MAEQEQSIFRKKTLDRISSPEQLTDYLRVSNPGIWIILIAVIVLLAGLFVWAGIGTLETTAPATVIIEDHTAHVAINDSRTISEGMTLRVSDQEVVIAVTETDSYGRPIGVAEVALPDGSYEGSVVVEQTRPLDFLLESR